jgi:hypothetical protein
MTHAQQAAHDAATTAWANYRNGAARSRVAGLGERVRAEKTPSVRPQLPRAERLARALARLAETQKAKQFSAPFQPRESAYFPHAGPRESARYGRQIAAQQKTTANGVV